jgi:hypothetical protein
MKYNEKMVLISNRSYQELLRKCNNEKSEKIYNNSITEEEKEEDKEKLQEENKEEEEQKNEKEKKVEDDSFHDLPLPPLEFFQSDKRRKRERTLHSKQMNEKEEKWTTNQKKGTRKKGTIKNQISRSFQKKPKIK